MKLSKKYLYFKWNSAMVALCVMIIGIVGSSTAIYATIAIGPFKSYVINKSGFTIWPIVADLNGDGYPDVGSNDAWYVNPKKISGTWEKKIIGGELTQVFGAYDFDNDGDIDLIGDNGDSEIATKFLWAENSGKGTFTVHNNIQFISGDFVQGVAIGKFYNGGPIEIAVSWHNEKIKDVHMITVPSSPKTAQWQTRSISAKSQGEALSKGDMDKDGDMDLLIGTSWLENPGNGTAQWTDHVLTTETFLKPVDRNDLVDFDGDGDLDAVIGFESRETPLLVYLAPSNVKSTWEKVMVSSSIGGGTYSLDAEDIDNDKDFDIIIGEQLGSKRVLVYENDGTGKKFTLHDMTGSNTKTAFHDGNPVVDLDLDGDKDIVFIGYGNAQNFLLYENLAISGPVNVVGAEVQKQFSFKNHPRVWMPGEFQSGAPLFDLQGKVHLGVPVKVNNIRLVK